MESAVARILISNSTVIEDKAQYTDIFQYSASMSLQLLAISTHGVDSSQNIRVAYQPLLSFNRYIKNDKINRIGQKCLILQRCHNVVRP